MKVVEKFKKILTNRNYSSRTIGTYAHYLEKFLEQQNSNPYHVTLRDIDEYLLNFPFTSTSQQNQIIGSLKLFAKYILGKKDIHLNKIERPKKEKKLPKIIDAEILATKINAIQNLKHKAILSLGLSCGLRISEVINLKWEHLDRAENLIYIYNGKGKKDRVTKLNDNMISLLTEYWREYKSKEYVFNGQSRNRYSTTSIQKLVKKYIHSKASYHLLRHSFSTYAIDNGTPLPVLQKSLGHSSSKTTEIYLHLSNKSVEQMKQAI